jgi:toxin-antitoxin system PIN domain toxin
MRALLDVNVLLALLDASHANHDLARDWISTEIEHGWASCPITQNAFVRIISQSRYLRPVTPAVAIELLAQAVTTRHHEFWPCDVSFVDGARILPSSVLGHRQVTDLYLLALAVEHGGRLVTLDRSIPLSAVPAATTEHLVVL